MSTAECHCKRFIALDSKNNETTPDRATGFILAIGDRSVHGGSAPLAEKALRKRELAKRGEGRQ